MSAQTPDKPGRVKKPSGTKPAQISLKQGAEIFGFCVTVSMRKWSDDLLLQSALHGSNLQLHTFKSSSSCGSLAGDSFHKAHRFAFLASPLPSRPRPKPGKNNKPKSISAHIFAARQETTKTTRKATFVQAQFVSYTVQTGNIFMTALFLR